jgi:microcystin-dependent protein
MKDLQHKKESSMTDINSFKSIVYAIIMIVIFGITAEAEIQNTFAFQGRLENADGSPISSTLNMTFRIYNDQSDEIWSESLPVNVIAGEYHLMLGESTPIAFTVNEQAKTFGITVEGDSEMEPRQDIGSVLRAGVALSITNAAITTSKIVDSAVTEDKIADNAVTARKLSVSTGSSLPNGNSGASLLSNGDGTFSWDNAIPPGVMMPFAGSAAPTGYLLCNGDAVSRTTYANLFTAIGTTYGAGDGSTTFNLPNTNGKVLVGYNSSETEFNTLGKTGGEKTHTLTTTEMPSHYHYVSLTTSTNGAHTHSYQKGDPGDNSISDNSGSFDEYDDMSATTGSAGNHNHTVSGNTGSKGSGGAHNNLQPYITLNYIIKY